MKTHENEKEVRDDPVEGGADVVAGEIATVVAVVEDGGDKRKWKQQKGNQTNQEFQSRFQLHSSRIGGRGVDH